MTDMRRTLLWVVFSMSLFLIWDAWNKHTGQPSLFSPAPAKVVPSGATPGVAGLPKPADVATASTAAATAPGRVPTAEPVVAEQAIITTDLVKATLSSEGGTLSRLELLKTPEHLEKQWYEPLTAVFGGAGSRPASDQRNVVLLDESAERLYVAQTGLIPAAGGSGLPNHHTVMSLMPGERSLQPGQNSILSGSNRLPSAA